MKQIARSRSLNNEMNESKRMTPRPYQSECVDAMFKSMIDGNEFGLVVIPTGGGKTVIFSLFIEEVYRRYAARRDKIRICIVAHRERLVSQARDKLLKVWPGSSDRIGMACASLSNDINIDSEIVIGSIQTLLSRLKSRGHDKIDPFDILLIDEAHRIPQMEKKSYYGKLISLTKELSPKRKVFGFTASPYRLGHGYIYGTACKPGHTNYFPKITFSEGMDSMISEGYLVPYRIKKSIDIGPELRRVPIVNGEYKNDKLGEIMCKFLHSAVDVYKTHGEMRKHVLAFCVNIDHAEQLADAFRQSGVTCQAIHSKLSMDVRNKRLDDFAKGKINVLASVDALIEGWDETSVDCLLMLRPTKSPMIYVQQGGRGLRPHTGKENLLVLDMADNFSTHGFFAHPRVMVPGMPMEGEAPTKICPDCDLALHASIRVCPECGHVFLVRKVNEPKKVEMEEVFVPSKPQNMRGRIRCHIADIKIREQGDSIRFVFNVLPPKADAVIQVCHWITQGDIKKKNFDIEWHEMTNLREIPKTLAEAALMASRVDYPESCFINFKQSGKFFAGWNQKGWTQRINETCAPAASYAAFVKKGNTGIQRGNPVYHAQQNFIKTGKVGDDMKACPQCGKSISRISGLCAHCGYKFIMRRKENHPENPNGK